VPICGRQRATRLGRPRPQGGIRKSWVDDAGRRLERPGLLLVGIREIHWRKATQNQAKKVVQPAVLIPSNETLHGYSCSLAWRMDLRAAASRHDPK
jgi:hypothetical protein